MTEPLSRLSLPRAAVAVTALALAAGLVTASPASAATGRITGLAGTCVDVAGGGSANGTPVQLYDCNGSAAQQWTVGADGTVRALGKCLDVVAGSVANGAKLQLWDCTGAANQRWTVTAARDLVNPASDKCADATGSSSANGTRLQLWSCTGAAKPEVDRTGRR
ncbi:hypothetical protein GCM10023220_60150 [Streptomyces ziwulingensis]|uniref:Ricin B lectin domain-containing protein n=1 Tax=Streptomyces ziwulingensis TaxID=1045501 RepID=A0ABP9CV78_9ACTN